MSRVTSRSLGLLQLDGRFGDQKSCLMAIIDDANSKIHEEFLNLKQLLPLWVV